LWLFENEERASEGEMTGTKKGRANETLPLRLPFSDTEWGNNLVH